jgi:hypothetical protein
MFPRLGQSDGRRSRGPQLLSSLGNMPFTQAQKAVLNNKAHLISIAAPWVHPQLSFWNPPADADTFIVSSLPAVQYPAPGASAVIVLTLTVPKSKFMVINKLAIVHIGGNPPDFTGQVIWRVLKNGGGLRGLATLTAQVGTFANPKSVMINGIENDTFVVTAEVPSAWAAMPGGTTTAASFDGFTYPLSEATYPAQGTW